MAGFSKVDEFNDLPLKVWVIQIMNVSRNQTQKPVIVEGFLNAKLIVVVSFIEIGPLIFLLLLLANFPLLL